MMCVDFDVTLMSQTAVSVAGQYAIERGSKAGFEPEPGNVATYDGARN